MTLCNNVLELTNIYERISKEWRILVENAPNSLKEVDY